MSKITQNAIVETFLELLHEKPFEKITVKDIVDGCDINRNTFYYYYQDIYDLLDYVFRIECNLVQEAFEKYDDMAEEYRRIFKIIMEFRPTVIAMYKGRGKEILEKYIDKATDIFFKRFVLAREGGDKLDKLELQLIVDFYKFSLTGYTFTWIEAGMPKNQENFIEAMATMFDATVDNLIKVVPTMDVNNLKNKKYE